jgi:hypothetical protein
MVAVCVADRDSQGRVAGGDGSRDDKAEHEIGLATDPEDVVGKLVASAG